MTSKNEIIKTQEEEEELKTAYLCLVRLVGDESDGYYRYEFIFTDNPDEVWGDNLEYVLGLFFETNIYLCYINE